jgi:hypothetical protein
VELVPRHVFDGRVVVQDLENGQNFLILLLVFLYVPNADALIAEPGNKQILIDSVPAESIAFRGVSDQFPHRFFHGCESDISFIGGDGGQARVCLAIPGSQYFSSVLDLLDDGDLMVLIFEIGFGWVRRGIHFPSLGWSTRIFCSWHWSISAELEAMMA